MGKVDIRYYVTRGGTKPGSKKWGYWAPCLARRSKKSGQIEPTLMAKLGFKLVDCGQDGPAAWARAETWNARWDETFEKWQRGELDDTGKVIPVSIERVYPPNSVGEAFARFRNSATWAKKKPRTQEDWMRGWKQIEPVFGDVDPRTIAFEDLDLWYGGDPLDSTIRGLLGQIGVRESHRAMKIWRAIWKNVLCKLKRIDGERYAEGEDPSLGIRRENPKARKAIWLYDEAERLVKRAIRMEYYGLAAALATCWDTQFSPVDVRSLTTAKLSDAQGPVFDVDRTKTGKGAIGTLSKRTQLLLKWYIQSLPFKLHPDTPIFHTRGGQPGPKGGRPRPPATYTKDTLSKDFRAVRDAEFPGDTRKVSDFRRSGAVEAVAGKVDPAALAAKMANSIDENKELQTTYLPHQAAVVRLADEARARGRSVLRTSKDGGQR